MLVRVSARLHPTEDGELVKRAILSVFPMLDVTVRESGVTGTTADTARFEDLLRRQKIRDTARMVMVRGLNTTRCSTAFELNKQAAFVGVVSFSRGETPLGGIGVTVEGDSDELEKWLNAFGPSKERRRRKRRGGGVAERVEIMKTLDQWRAPDSRVLDEE